MFLELSPQDQSYLSPRKWQIYFFNYSVFAGFGRDLSPSHSLNLSGSIEPVRIRTGCRGPKRDKLGLSCSASKPVFCGFLQYLYLFQGTVRQCDNSQHNHFTQTGAGGNLDKCQRASREIQNEHNH